MSEARLPLWLIVEIGRMCREGAKHITLTIAYDPNSGNVSLKYNVDPLGMVEIPDVKDAEEQIKRMGVDELIHYLQELEPSAMSSPVQRHDPNDGLADAVRVLASDWSSPYVNPKIRAETEARVLAAQIEEYLKNYVMPFLLAYSRLIELVFGRDNPLLRHGIQEWFGYSPAEKLRTSDRLIYPVFRGYSEDMLNILIKNLRSIGIEAKKDWPWLRRYAQPGFEYHVYDDRLIVAYRQTPLAMIKKPDNTPGFEIHDFVPPVGVTVQAGAYYPSKPSPRYEEAKRYLKGS